MYLKEVSRSLVGGFVSSKLSECACRDRFLVSRHVVVRYITLSNKLVIIVQLDYYNYIALLYCIKFLKII